MIEIANLCHLAEMCQDALLERVMLNLAALPWLLQTATASGKAVMQSRMTITISEQTTVCVRVWL